MPNQDGKGPRVQSPKPSTPRGGDQNGPCTPSKGIKVPLKGTGKGQMYSPQKSQKIEMPKK